MKIEVLLIVFLSQTVVSLSPQFIHMLLLPLSQKLLLSLYQKRIIWCIEYSTCSLTVLLCSMSFAHLNGHSLHSPLV